MIVATRANHRQANDRWAKTDSFAGNEEVLTRHYRRTIGTIRAEHSCRANPGKDQRKSYAVRLNPAPEAQCRIDHWPTLEARTHASCDVCCQFSQRHGGGQMPGSNRNRGDARRERRRRHIADGRRGSAFAQTQSRRRPPRHLARSGDDLSYSSFADTNALGDSSGANPKPRASAFEKLVGVAAVSSPETRQASSMGSTEHLSKRTVTRTASSTRKNSRSRGRHLHRQRREAAYPERGCQLCHRRSKMSVRHSKSDRCKCSGARGHERIRRVRSRFTNGRTSRAGTWWRMTVSQPFNGKPWAIPRRLDRREPMARGKCAPMRISEAAARN